MARKSKEIPHLRLRVPPALLARLEKLRVKSGRTLTGEIVHHIEQSFQKDDTVRLIKKTAHAFEHSREKEYEVIASRLWELHGCLLDGNIPRF